MTPNLPSILRRLAPLGALGLLGLVPACNVVQPAQEDPTRYFILSDPGAAVAPVPAAGDGVRVGLREVRMESYLKNRDMVIRTRRNEIEYRDFMLWAEPLGTAVARVVRTSMAGSPKIAQVISWPFPFDQRRDFDVTVDVRRCEGAVGASGHFVASFSAVIEISTVGASPHLVMRKEFVSPDAAWNGTDFDQLASLLSSDVAALAREIVADIPSGGGS